jgi:hypothetical protein
MKQNDAFEKHLIDVFENMGLSLLGITPYGNFDKFYFYRQVKNDEVINANIWFNGQGYCLFTGKNNILKTQNDKFELSYDEMIALVEGFAEKNKLLPFRDGVRD